MSKNGATAVEKANLSYDDKLDILIQALSELHEKVEELIEQNDELVEKLSNITASGPGFDVEDFGGN